MSFCGPKIHQKNDCGGFGGTVHPGGIDRGPLTSIRTEAEIREWVQERRDHERRNAPAERNTPAAGMTMGALETLDAFEAWLNGDDEA